MDVVKTIILLLAIISIAFTTSSCMRIHTASHAYPNPPEHVDKSYVLNKLEYMRDTHIRNRGVYNSPEYDDYIVRVYDAIIKWVEEQ